MTPQSWERVSEVFEEVEPVPAAERGVVLQRLCGGDTELRREVEALLEASSHAAGFLAVPAMDLLAGLRRAAGPQLEAGAVLAGRFEIVWLLGRGGMGEVYATRDRELGGAAVAVKLIRAEVAADPGQLARLKREVLIARKISHPNVCRIHDFVAGDVSFLTMELLEGESLAEFLKRERPPTAATARGWLAQMAAGLDAAHAAGVMHRDLKPGNVMLAGERVVITDFGLARAAVREMETAPGTRTPGGVMGTLAYMAPELLRGEAPTRASDIYAFGLMARELGCPLEACLAHEAGQRPATAAEALAGLPKLEAKARGLWWIAVGTAAVVAVALGVAVYRYIQVRPQIAAGEELLLTPVVNATLDPQLDAATTALGQQLAQSNQFQITTEAQIQQQYRRMNRPLTDGDAVLAQQPAVAREVAMRRGAPLVVFASLTRLAGAYRLDMELERVGHDPDAAAKTWSHSETADAKTGVFDALHAAATWVRTLAGEQPQDLASTDQPPQDITTPSWEALAEYQRAEQEQASGHGAAAVALLQQATTADPGFALGFARLGDIEVAHRQLGAGYGDYRTALRLAKGQRRLSVREELRLEGATDTDLDDFAGAKKAFQAYSALYPDDYLGWFYQGYPDLQMGQIAAAFSDWQRAQLASPASPFPAIWEARADIWLGHWNDAAAAITHARGLGNTNDSAELAASLADAKGDYTHASEALGTLRSQGTPYWRAIADLLDAARAAWQGDEERASNILRSRLADSAVAGPGMEAQFHLDLASLDFSAGNDAGLVKDCQDALATDPNPTTQATAGTWLARSGHLALARYQLRALSAERDLAPLASIEKYRLQGEVLLAEHRPQEAIPLLRRATVGGGMLADQGFLARALSAAGESQSAQALHQISARNPGRVWWWPESFPSGEIADLSHQAAKAGEHHEYQPDRE